MKLMTDRAHIRWKKFQDRLPRIGAARLEVLVDPATGRLRGLPRELPQEPGGRKRKSSSAAADALPEVLPPAPTGRGLANLY